jgi:poly(A) polymerase
VNSVDLFPSDHFGVEAVLHFSSEDDALVKTALQAARMIESADGNAKRDNAIEFLNTMYNQWLAASEEPSNDTNVIAIGSYALGIHSASGDVDALCVGNLAPADFFKEFPKILKANGNRVGLIRVVTDALVPLIKTSIDGIKFDILYANVPIQMPTSLNLKKALTTLEDNILRSMDDQSVLSLNGHIEAQLLLSAVPNIPHFQTVCRFIKVR